MFKKKMKNVSLCPKRVHFLFSLHVHLQFVSQAGEWCTYTITFFTSIFTPFLLVRPFRVVCHPFFTTHQRRPPTLQQVVFQFSALFSTSLIFPVLFLLPHSTLVQYSINDMTFITKINLNSNKLQGYAHQTI